MATWLNQVFVEDYNWLTSWCVAALAGAEACTHTSSRIGTASLSPVWNTSTAPNNALECAAPFFPSFWNADKNAALFLEQTCVVLRVSVYKHNDQHGSTQWEQCNPLPCAVEYTQVFPTPVMLCMLSRSLFPVEYAQVIKMLGNGRLEAMCFDGVKRLCHIRGKLRKKVWINTSDIILVGLRDYQDNKADVILKYNADEARSLKAYGELPEHAKINETDTFGPGDDEDIQFDDIGDDDEDIDDI
uniref:Eukaryotic translation initiation factor 4C n=2 Tax=Salmoninae TaxID=504568 RepID=A0A4W5K6I2_9TELE